ncbi:unnamed protein product [Moneuplotes crassus]|uniref:Uncharacterized protein n=1 Tax=Euplotes crassus TaxID=5936 RepID=A0AAD1XZN3_EUPCR|nr:unnamed protein product [Moneuplotes crassus]
MLARSSHSLLRKTFVIRNQLRFSTRSQNRTRVPLNVKSQGTNSSKGDRRNKDKNYRIYPFFYILSFGILGRFLSEVNTFGNSVKELIASAPEAIQDDLQFMKFYQGEINMYSNLTNEEVNSLQKHSELLVSGAEKILNTKVNFFAPVSACGLAFHFSYFNMRGWKALPIITFSIWFLWIVSTSYLLLNKKSQITGVLDEWRRVNQEITKIIDEEKPVIN